MKAVTIRQPWASLVAITAKKNETRSWATKYRGPLAIHASARMSHAQKELCYREPFKTALSDAGLFYPLVAKLGASHKKDRVFPYDFPLGAVIATCNLLDCLEIVSVEVGSEDVSLMLRLAESNITAGATIGKQEYAFGDYTPGRFVWRLADVKQIEPVPAKGRLGLWNWEG